jgi:hypothetical protein
MNPAATLHNILLPLLMISAASTAQVHESYNVGLLAGPVLTNQTFPSGVGAVYSGVESTSEISSWNYSVQAYKVKALPKNWQLEFNISFDRYRATTEYNYESPAGPGMTTSMERDVRYIATGSKILRQIGHAKWTISPFGGFAIEYLVFSQDKSTVVNSSGAPIQFYTDVTRSERRINFNYDIGFTVGYDVTSKVMLTLRPYYKHNFEESVSGKLFYGYGILLGARLK